MLFDPNGDGELVDGESRPGYRVYLDANYNGRLDEGERTVTTGTNGGYLFDAVPDGVHHVRQELAPPSVQTLPNMALIPTPDRLPDEVVQYLHAAPGVGQFDVPYGKNASDWPGQWADLDLGDYPVAIDSPELVLKPIGVRARFSGPPTYGAETISLPEGAVMTLRFDEAIVDGPGADFQVFAITDLSAGEQIEIRVGSQLTQLTSLGIFDQSDVTIDVDLADVGLPGPVYFVELISQNSNGSFPGFDLVGLEAINFAAPDPNAYIVEVTPEAQVHADKDFGRFAQDLPPTVTIGVEDNDPQTPELRAGESATVAVRALDDVGLSGVELSVNGQLVLLNVDNEADIDLSNPGEIVLVASAVDSAGQTSQTTAYRYVATADGAYLINPNIIGQTDQSAETAPRVRILSPEPGLNSVTDIEIVASITGDPMPTEWVLEYAQVDLVDPYDMGQDDPDYVEIAVGIGGTVSEAIGTVPLSTLADDIYFVRLTARNALDQVAYFGQVLAKNVPEAELRPSIVIDGPTQGSQIPMTVDITGTITSSRPLNQWYVEYAKAATVDPNNIGADGPDWKRIAQGTQPIPTSSVIATFDATVLRNDSYIVRVVAENVIGLGWVEPVPLEVIGEAKLGRNRLEFTDFSIDLAGFPLELVRSYDSLEAGRSGELGFGWSLALSDPNIGETVPDTGALGLFGSTPFRVGTRVYVTAPTGERLGFTFDVIPGAAGALGQSYAVQFVPDPGNYYRLEVPEGDDAFLNLKDDGSVFLFFINLPYNPETYVLITPDGLRYTVHEDRGLLRAEDPNGNSLNVNPQTIAHSAGPAINLTRDSQGRITAISDPEGNTWQYAYDATGDLISVTDPDLNITSYIYSVTNPHYLDTIMDPQGRMPRRYEYDPDDGRLVAVIDEEGNRRETSVDPLGFVGSVTDGRGNTTVLEYNERGNVTLIEDAGGYQSRYEYNDPANPDLATRFIDQEGGAWTYEYDAMGRPTILETPLTTFRNIRYEASYDAFGNVTRYETPEFNVSTYAYDQQGNRLSETPADGVAANFEYGASGQLARRTVSASDYQALGYDSNGFPNHQSNSAGYELELVNLANGRVAQRTDASGTLDVTFTPGGLLSAQVDQEGNTATLTENLDGSLTRVDRNGNSTQIVNNADNQPVAVNLPGGGQVQTTYDADGNPTQITDPLGNAVDYEFDFANRVTAIEDPLGNREVYTRDGVGNVVEQVDRNGRRRTFEWDANRRLIAERWHDGAIIVREIIFTYEPTRGLVQVDDTSDGVTYTQSFRGRLPRITRVDYTLPGQADWRISYDWSSEAEFPVRLRVGPGVSVSNDIRANYFDGETVRLRWTHPEGVGNEVQIVRNLDSTVRELRRLTGNDGGGAQSRSEFNYDSQQRITSIAHLDSAGLLLDPRARLTYTRDAEGRLLGESHDANSAAFAHDADGQIVAVDHSAPGYLDEIYGYDLGGNRLTSHLAAGQATFSAANRIAISGEFTFDHDNAGNLVRRTNTSTGEVAEFEYDHRNRLIRATVKPSLGAPPDDEFLFEYDYLDRLLFRVVNGAKTWVLHDRDQPIAEFADGASELSAAFLYDPAKLDDLHAIWRAGSGERWLLKDQLGSIRGITDAAFSLLSWVDYDSYGNLQPGSVPAASEPWRFAARPYVETLGLYHNRSRFYDPSLGRFTQEDPTKHGGRDHHFYRYALNSPAGFTDPSGEISAANYQRLVNFLVDKTLEGVDNQVPSGGDLPCQIAEWSAVSFGYFDPLAALILNPSDESLGQDIEPVEIFPFELAKILVCN